MQQCFFKKSWFYHYHFLHASLDRIIPLWQLLNADAVCEKKRIHEDLGYIIILILKYIH